MFRLSSRWILPLLLSVLCAPTAFAAEPAAVTYVITLKHADAHYADIAMGFVAQPGAKIQLPVWNATYIVRDFAANVSDMRQHRADGSEPVLLKLDKTTWTVPAESGAVELRYRIYLNDPGPFGAEVSADHAFFNFAQVLPYVVGDEHRKQLTTVNIVDVPAVWKMATPLPNLGGPASDGKSASFTLHAESYDRLVDSPTELGVFDERDFTDGGKRYRVIVHGAAGDYDLAHMAADIQKIVHSETDFMHEAPLEEYTFIYHVNASGGGGMEHAYSTAIGLPPLKDERAWHAFDDVTAHEFFHLWNVKRIIPQELAPVDYTREMYTRELWFSEGVTSTVAEYMLLRAGLNDEKYFQETLASAIQQFRSRPAHLWQSPEESSLDTWFTQDSNYNLPDCSVSYYLSGELLGFLLDLDLREHSGGKKSLRDLLQSMNESYAHQGRFFPDNGVQNAAAALAGADYSKFFAENVAHASDLPFAAELASVGWKLDAIPTKVGDAGFDLARGAMRMAVVSRVRSDAARAAAVNEGDQIVKVNGAAVENFRDATQKIAALEPGSTLHLSVRRGGAPLDLSIAVGSRDETQYTITDLPNATAEQLARRKAWLATEDER